jgi:hypothetical protein
MKTNKILKIAIITYDAKEMEEAEKLGLDSSGPTQRIEYFYIECDDIIAWRANTVTFRGVEYSATSISISKNDYYSVMCYVDDITRVKLLEDNTREVIELKTTKPC